MKLYTKDGWLNTEQILDSKYPYNLVIGGRGTGKTYGFLKNIIERGAKAFYMRRTQVQRDISAIEDLSPLKAVCADNSWTYKHDNISKYITRAVVEDTGAIIYIVALSTFANVRGFDASDISYLVYDECIGEPHERKIKNEGLAFLNAVETISRNRELQGKEPLKVYLLTNSNTMYSDLLAELKVLDKLEQMCYKGKEVSFDDKRGIALYFLRKSAISQRKTDTSLYKLAGDSDFTTMAISNEFADNDFSVIKSLDLKPFKPIFYYNGMCLYRHKSEKKYYFSEHYSGKCEIFTTTEKDKEYLKRNYGFLEHAYLTNRLFFETYQCYYKYKQLMG